MKQLLYKVDKFYNSESERGILFNDKDLAIDWKLKYDQLLFSEKDANQPNFKMLNIIMSSILVTELQVNWAVKQKNLK